jgi:2-polyprenyl-3-methyl-5-hydroxy-6-metoxy-1,4-benzoquinol methylase
MAENLGRRERPATTNRWELSTEPSLADKIMFDTRIGHYDALFSALGLTPLRDRRLFDAGCANGKWLEICCRRWGARQANCAGNDQREEPWKKWRHANPDTEITFIPRASHEIELAPGSFDIVHQSMMLSSIIDPAIRTRSAEVLWQLLRPGGILISYDFWLNPLNPATLGVRASELRRLFPQGRMIYRRLITLAPPLGRSLTILGKSAALALEKLRILNTHLLIAIERLSGA